MKIYIAGKWEAKARLQAMRAKLSTLGHQVTSTWLNPKDSEEPEPSQGSYSQFMSDRDHMRAIAYRDLLEVKQSDLLILDTLDASVTGGREVEFGWAQGHSIPIWLVGPPRNPFHYLIDLRFLDWEGLWEFLTP